MSIKTNDILSIHVKLSIKFIEFLFCRPHSLQISRSADKIESSIWCCVFFFFYSSVLNTVPGTLRTMMLDGKDQASVDWRHQVVNVGNNRVKQHAFLREQRHTQPKNCSAGKERFIYVSLTQ